MAVRGVCCHLQGNLPPATILFHLFPRPKLTQALPLPGSDRLERLQAPPVLADPGQTKVARYFTMLTCQHADSARFPARSTASRTRSAAPS
eukprot:299809-Rhodomonas_salina.1